MTTQATTKEDLHLALEVFRELLDIYWGIGIIQLERLYLRDDLGKPYHALTEEQCNRLYNQLAETIDKVAEGMNDD